MRWLLIILTGLAFLLSACGKTGSGEKIAVVNWDKVLQAHPQYETLHKKQEEYNLLLDRRKEHELIGKTQMSGLARLQQLKQNSKQNYLSADFMTRMTERQTAEQEKLKQLSSQIADQVDKELAEEEKQMNEHYPALKAGYGPDDPGTAQKAGSRAACGAGCQGPGQDAAGTA